MNWKKPQNNKAKQKKHLLFWVYQSLTFCSGLVWEHSLKSQDIPSRRRLLPMKLYPGCELLLHQASQEWGNRCQLHPISVTRIFPSQPTRWWSAKPRWLLPKCLLDLSVLFFHTNTLKKGHVVKNTEQKISQSHTPNLCVAWSVWEWGMYVL